MTAPKRATVATIDGLQQALVDNALTGELDGFSAADQAEAARFLTEVAATRQPGEATIRVESTGGEAGRRRMRIAIVNDDMPFLVDSVANAIAARHLTIHRLLHPVVCVERTDDGTLTAARPKCDDSSTRESMMYLELDRADARARQELVSELHAVLADVRVAVRDWSRLQQQLREQHRDHGGDGERGEMARAAGGLSALGDRRPGQHRTRGPGRRAAGPVRARHSRPGGPRLRLRGRVDLDRA